MKRTELARHDLTGSNNMEMIVSVVEVPPGATFPRHIHLLPGELIATAPLPKWHAKPVG